MRGPTVICGARGFVGSHLTQALVERGHTVRAGSRHPERVDDTRPEVTWVELDVERPETLGPAFEGADAVVYLVHQMSDGGAGLEAREAASALAVREAAEAAGVRRLVYLGGPAPTGPISKHLAARLRTGQILRGGSLSAIELRAGMIIGAGSESWWIVRDLALRLPVMVLPRWLRNRSEPIAIDDVVRALIRAIEQEHEGSAWYDLPGPEQLTARQILERVAGVLHLRPWMFPVPVLTPRLSSHWLRLVTRADYVVSRQLVDGLNADLVATGTTFWALHPDLERTPFDTGVERAFAAETPIGGLRARLERLRLRRAAGQSETFSKMMQEPAPGT